MNIRGAHSYALTISQSLLLSNNAAPAFVSNSNSNGKRMTNQTQNHARAFASNSSSNSSGKSATNPPQNEGEGSQNGSNEERGSDLGWNGEQGKRGRERDLRWIEKRAQDGNEGGGVENCGGVFGRGDGGAGSGGGRGEGRSVSRGRGRGGDWTPQQSQQQPWIERGGSRLGDGGGSRSTSRFSEHRHWCCAESELPAVLEKFVLVSYNILADKNVAHHYNELYHHIPWWMMNWDRRKNKLVQELGLWSPDIMCLQEVDRYEDLRDVFQRRGYSGIYKGRTGGAHDGCAIFWKRTRFQLLQEESIQFNQLGLRDNVAQLCVFQSIAKDPNNELNIEGQHQNIGVLTTPLCGVVPSSIDCVSDYIRTKRGIGSLVVVGNIHVLFNPKRGDVKLGQVRNLLKSAHALSEQWGGAPVTIAGDFNSTPTSDVYKFLATSELDISGLNRATMSGQVEAEEGAPSPVIPQSEQASTIDRYWTSLVSNQLEQSAEPESPNKFVKRWHWTAEELLAATGTLNSTMLHHNLNLRSAYTQIKGEAGCRDAQGEPLVTTFHRKFMGTVDYIWHTEGIDTVKVLDTLPVNILQRSQGLPSRKWGSDHLALACELAFLPDS